MAPVLLTPCGADAATIAQRYSGEMTGAANIHYLMVQGEEKGPFTPDQVRSMLTSGVISQDTMCKRNEAWYSLAHLMSSGEHAKSPGRYFLKIGGDEKGPFLFDQVQSMWSTGQITADTMYRLQEVWRPLGNIANGAHCLSGSHKQTPTLPTPLSVIHDLERQLKTTAGSVVCWILLSLCIVASAASMSRGVPGAGAFFGVILGILVLRGWCKRRAIKVLRQRSWQAMNYFRRIYLPSVWGLLWRSFLVFVAIAFVLAFACSESPRETQAFFGTPIAFWLLCVLFTADVPLWIRRKLLKNQIGSC